MTKKPTYISPNLPSDSEWQELAEKLLRADDIPGVMVFVGDICEQNKMTTSFAEWIFKKAENWHLQGWSKELWLLYELIGKYISEGWMVLHGLGCRAQILGENEKAQDYFEKALERKPDYAYSRLALGQIRMLRTAFLEGRELYEARFVALGDEENMAWKEMLAPRWRGENLKDKTIYFWDEQGLGDIIMLAGLLPHLLEQSPKNIILGMSPRMISLFTRSFPEITIEPIDKIAEHNLSPIILEVFPALLKQLGNMPLPPEVKPMQQDYERALQQGKLDHAAPMGDLLVQCMPQFAPAKDQRSYIKPDPERVKHVRKNLEKLGNGRKIGISWHTTNSKDGILRNINLEQLKPILSVKGCHFISLQHDVPREIIENFCNETGHIIHIEKDFDPIGDLEGLVALIACMDEVITIDNSNAHIAGALGIPTIIMLPKGCNFRWPLLDDPTKNMWYSSVKLVRQSVIGDWRPVITRVTESLKISCGS